MPVFRTGSKLHYFAHVPKCGGSSVELYLQQRFGEMAFVDYTSFDRETKKRRWSRTSPQHVAWTEFARLMPGSWISGVFGVVRHPEARLISAYHHFTDSIADDASCPELDDWFARWLAREDYYQYDNHLLPQSELIPNWATVFRLEEGLDAVIPYLDELAGDTAGARALPAINKRKADGTGRPRAQVSEATRALIAETYAEDFTRFGYVLGGGLMDRPRPMRRPVPHRQGPLWKIARRVRYWLKSQSK
jgi:hypothetical protein